MDDEERYHDEDDKLLETVAYIEFTICLAKHLYHFGFEDLDDAEEARQLHQLVDPPDSYDADDAVVFDKFDVAAIFEYLLIHLADLLLALDEEVLEQVNGENGHQVDHEPTGQIVDGNQIPLLNQSVVIIDQHRVESEHHVQEEYYVDCVVVDLPLEGVIG